MALFDIEKAPPTKDDIAKEKRAMQKKRNNMAIREALTIMTFGDESPTTFLLIIIGTAIMYVGLFTTAGTALVFALSYAKQEAMGKKRQS